MFLRPLAEPDSFGQPLVPQIIVPNVATLPFGVHCVAMWMSLDACLPQPVGRRPFAAGPWVAIPGALGWQGAGNDAQKSLVAQSASGLDISRVARVLAAM